MRTRRERERGKGKRIWLSAKRAKIANGTTRGTMLNSLGNNGWRGDPRLCSTILCPRRKRGTRILSLSLSLHYFPLSFFCWIGRNRRHEAERESPHNNFSSLENGNNNFPLPITRNLPSSNRKSFSFELFRNLSSRSNTLKFGSGPLAVSSLSLRYLFNFHFRNNIRRKEKFRK